MRICPKCASNKISIKIMIEKRINDSECINCKDKARTNV